MELQKYVKDKIMEDYTKFIAKTYKGTKYEMDKKCDKILMAKFIKFYFLSDMIELTNEQCYKMLTLENSIETIYNLFTKDKKLKDGIMELANGNLKNHIEKLCGD